MKIIASKWFLIVSGIFILSSCNDPELNALMEDYCHCISEAKENPMQRIECIELMDSIENKYKNDPTKIKMVIDKTDNCY